MKMIAIIGKIMKKKWKLIIKNFETLERKNIHAYAYLYIILLLYKNY